MFAAPTRGIAEEQRLTLPEIDEGTSACEAGYVPACNYFARTLATMAGSGQFGQINLDYFDRALSLYEKSCGLGHEASSYGCEQLGHMLQNKYSPYLDPIKAFYYIKKSCSPSNFDICVNIGYWYQDGESFYGVRKNTDRAVEFYGNSCIWGSAVGCLHTAELYEQGMFVKRDIFRASKLRARACEIGAPPLYC